MAFLRNSNRERFTVIDNQAIRDDNLSLKALGLLVKLLSFPDNWEFSENGLEKVFKKDGQTAIRSGLKELEKLGYLKREKLRDEKGKILRVEWKITENPQVDIPRLDNPNFDNPNFDNQPQYNTNEYNTNEYNTDDIYIDNQEKNKSSCPYQEIVDLYHSICVSYPELRIVTDKRKKHINARWKEYKDIEVFRELFEKTENSSFLKGNGKDGWKANFDWLMDGNNFAKVLEGNYKGTSSAKPKSNLPTDEDYSGGIY